LESIRDGKYYHKGASQWWFPSEHEQGTKIKNSNEDKHTVIAGPALGGGAGTLMNFECVDNPCKTFGGLLAGTLIIAAPDSSRLGVETGLVIVIIFGKGTFASSRSARKPCWPLDIT
jgi:hypothetical protein